MLTYCTVEKYVGKTLKEAIEKASLETGKPVAEVKKLAHVVWERKTLFSTEVAISLFSAEDVFRYCTGYLDKVLALLNVRATYSYTYQEKGKVISIDIKTSDGSRVIGRNGENLKAINNLARSAVFNLYGGEYRILLDCDSYKSSKYDKVRAMALEAARDVLTSHVPAVLPPMPSDERKVVHEALSGMKDIDDPSVDIGKRRHITIRYVPGHICRSADSED